MTTFMNVTGDEATCIKSMNLMATGGLDDIASCTPADATNREAKAEPPASRGMGPEATYATALWRRATYSDLRWEAHDAVQEGELVVVHSTVSGRRPGPFTAYAEDASVTMVFPRPVLHSPSHRPTDSV